MTRIEKLSVRQKLIYGMVGNDYITAPEVLKIMRKIDPSMKINSVADNLLKLNRKKLIDRKMINKLWNYVRPIDARSVKIITKEAKKNQVAMRQKISKSFDGKSMSARIYDHLCKKVGKIVNANSVAAALKLDKTTGTIYGHLKQLKEDGFLIVAGNNPITYEVLAGIVDSNKQKPKPKQLAPTVVEPEAQVEMFEAEPRAVPDFQNIKMGDIVNSIVQLQQQVTVYKTALEHIASILEQAGIIESE
jgi:Fe2+ or Zn2+ uptake regulation protein